MNIMFLTKASGKAGEAGWHRWHSQVWKDCTSAGKVYSYVLTLPSSAGKVYSYVLTLPSSKSKRQGYRITRIYIHIILYADSHMSTSGTSAR